MNIEDKILALIKMANPEDPVAYTQSIVKILNVLFLLLIPSP